MNATLALFIIAVLLIGAFVYVNRLENRKPKLKLKHKRGWSVWVGDGEINSNYYEEFEEARGIARWWRDNMGYDDTCIEEVDMYVSEAIPGLGTFPKHIKWIRKF